ncbi:MAG: transposase [Thiolinea sp.]
MKTGTALSAGLKALPDKVSSFASTQAAWRFYANESVTLPVLQAPLTASAQTGLRQQCDAYGLCIHDWSRLAFKQANKPDTYAITHEHDVGYDLQSSLLVSDRDGQPLAPVALRLVSRDGSYATYEAETAAHPVVREHLDEVTHCMATLEQQAFDKPLVHIIDREADSVGHIRQWEQGGYHWLVRIKGNSRLTHQGKTTNGKAIAQTLSFEKARPVVHQGKKHWQWIAETPVSLTRPAKPSRKKSPKPAVPGSSVAARLVVSRILTADGQLLAEWFLLTNVAAVDAATVALWYYWRWRIESFFKLMKSAGHQLESWQQESALAIAKRLLVASMACVTVWAIAADQGKEAEALKTLLIKLSGRQMKRKQLVTYPALLDGLWALLAMLEIMETYSPEQLDGLRETARRFV